MMGEVKEKGGGREERGGERRGEERRGEERRGEERWRNDHNTIFPALYCQDYTVQALHTTKAYSRRGTFCPGTVRNN